MSRARARRSLPFTHTLGGETSQALLGLVPQGVVVAACRRQRTGHDNVPPPPTLKSLCLRRAAWACKADGCMGCPRAGGGGQALAPRLT